jgi:phospholipid/cholesterol/gamma-HCH transport system substrate-binding protein
VNSTRLAGIGAFVLGGLALFVLGLFMIGDRQMAFADRFIVYTEFVKVTGLQPGAVIRVSGARGGAVGQILPPADPGGRFRVTLEIIEDLHQLVRTDSIASIESEGLVGGSYLAVSTGSAEAPRAPDGSTIPSREPFEIADLMQQMTATIANINDSIDLLTGQLQTVAESVTVTLSNTNALIEDVLGEVLVDVKTITTAGARISADMAEISDGIRRGEGTLGKLVYDDELYQKATRIVASAEEVATDVREVVAQARQMLDQLQGDGGPMGGVAGMTANLTETLDQARVAMTGFADNMEALKRNFLFRGFFNGRGYFDLASISPAEYRRGVLESRTRRPVRVWLRDDLLFERGDDGGERLTADGRARVDSALAPFVDRVGEGVVMVEGFAQGGTAEERYIVSRGRAAAVRDHLLERFNLDPQATGLMPLGSDSAGSPSGDRWSGIAVAVFLEMR